MIIVNYLLLRKQKATLVKKQKQSRKYGEAWEHLEGVINLLDAIEDERPFDETSNS